MLFICIAQVFIPLSNRRCGLGVMAHAPRTWAASSLQVSSPVPLSMLVMAMTSLVLPTSGSLLLWTRVITLTFIWHDNSRTFKNMLRTTGHIWREPVSMPIKSFCELFIFKSLRINITCSCFLQNIHVTIEMLSSRHHQIVVQPFTNTSR